METLEQGVKFRFKVNNKLYCYISHFTLCLGVSIFNFEQVNADWVAELQTLHQLVCFL